MKFLITSFLAVPGLLVAKVVDFVRPLACPVSTEQPLLFLCSSAIITSSPTKSNESSNLTLLWSWWLQQVEEVEDEDVEVEVVVEEEEEDDDLGAVEKTWSWVCCVA